MHFTLCVGRALTGESWRLERASAVTFFFPGMCITWNLNFIACSLKFSSLGFSISSRFLSFPKVEISGL